MIHGDTENSSIVLPEGRTIGSTTGDAIDELARRYVAAMVRAAAAESSLLRANDTVARLAARCNQAERRCVEMTAKEVRERVELERMTKRRKSKGGS